MTKHIRNDEEYLTASQFAKEIGVHKNSLYNWEHTGKLKPHHKTPGGHNRYTKKQVTEFLKKK